MYYRWTEKARPFISSSDGVVIGKWYRISYQNMKNRWPHYLNWIRQGDMEIKDESSSPKQLAQRRMRLFQGQMLSLVSQQRALVNSLKANYPHIFNRYTSHDNVIAEFHADVANIDTVLLLKKYYPDVYKPTEEGN